MELKPGYKQTEVGVIPEDWEVKSLGQIMEYIKGFPFKADDYQSHGIRVLRVSDTTYDGIREGGGIYIDEKKAKSCLKWSLKEGDLIVSTVGSKPPMYSSMVGKVTFIQARDSGSLLNQNAVILRGRSSSIAIQRVLHNHFRQGRYLKYIEKIFRGNANQASITLRELLEYRIPFTPFGAEQEAIAEALSDADALIESLEQLIAKKRQIKQGAMQELLTGKNRLPGFRGEWEVKSLGDLFSFSGGYSASRDQLSSEGTCYLHYGDIHGSSKMIINTKTDYQDIPKLNIPLKKISSFSLLKDGDVVFVDASEDDEGTSKHVVVVNKDDIPFIAGLHTIVAKSKTDELTNEYRRYCFQTASVHQQFLFYAVGTKVSGISKTNIPKLMMPVPPSPEQTAIAEFLINMDAELSALIQRRDKTRKLKQAMMQNLLTGKIRIL